MRENLKVYNSLTSTKELFEPLNSPYVGMYVCGPTVYSDVHLGNLRSFLSFDIIFRYLRHLDYKVRYVRNITDVGHLENDSDEGEDKIAKKAKLENLEPMEVVARYTSGFHKVAHEFNLLDPSIEPVASGHIIEQIALIERIMQRGLAYEVNGSVYFDVMKYHQDVQAYGTLSGRVIEDLISGTRDLDGQSDKRSPLDFALWKKASAVHIMRWPSPWSEGFPGWHLECSSMSTKYLGEQFDIHGGGMDLKFPHHECEIAQSVAGNGSAPAKYWLHGNMLTVNGQKMSKSLGNSFLPDELFSGKHKLLDRAYSPMTVRFFMLQTHYRSTLDFSNEALTASAKGYKKLINGLRVSRKLRYEQSDTELDSKLQEQINKLCDNCYHAMNDDFNTAQTIAHLFNMLKKINSIFTKNLNPAAIGEEAFTRLINTYQVFIEDVLGLKEEQLGNQDGMMALILETYKQAKAVKDYDKVDFIRGALKEQGVVLKDMKDGVDWAYEE